MKCQGREAVEEVWETWGGDWQDVNWRALEDLVQLWRVFGVGTNLLGSTDEAFLWKQVGEGLMAARVMREAGFGGRAWLDVGSGGGLPGLIIAMAVDGSGTLVEPRQKRFDFLQLAQRKLGLGDVKVRRGRVDGGTFVSIDGEPCIASGFDVVSSRAVFGIQDWLEIASSWVGKDGLVLIHGREGQLVPKGWVTCHRLLWEGWCVFGVQRQ